MYGEWSRDSSFSSKMPFSDMLILEHKFILRIIGQAKHTLLTKPAFSCSIKRVEKYAQIFQKKSYH